MNGVINLTGLEKGLKEEDIIYIYIYIGCFIFLLGRYAPAQLSPR